LGKCADSYNNLIRTIKPEGAFQTLQVSL